MLRRGLDAVYAGAAVAAAACLLAIAALVSAQVIGRLADVALRAIGQPRYGFVIPSLAEICGFLLVAATFLALASTLRHAVHIRVNLLLQNLPERPRQALQIIALAVSAAMVGYATLQAVDFTLDSWRFGEVSYGIIAVPLVLPKAAMAAGLAVFTVALLDDLAAALAGRPPSFETGEAAALGGMHGRGGE